MKRIRMLLITIAALGAAACGGKKDEPKPTVTSGSAADMAAGSADGSAGSGSAGSGSAAGMAAGSADPGTGAEVDVPTDVDFETEAAAKIDEKNVEAQLKAIEQELAQQ